MTQNSVIYCLRQHNQRMALLRGSSAAFVGVVVLLCCLQGCTGKSGQKPATRVPDVSRDHRQIAPVDPHPSHQDMPRWLDLYREKSLLSISSVDHVVIITFDTLADRDEVYRYYADKFGNEENFASFRNGRRDIISFIKEGYGVKITLLNPSKNLWSLEYHRQSI
ncbi:MAG TPA: hypothetical protein ENL01_03045 [Chlorobaculum parvum]|uniref:Uncharacterized protein n=1 Tax=Chlorobaculum parvum TaxID=274539 RepID=A0A7C5DC22_9CHLB|nr:hypothetical protein [Chlorobaculum parvum]